MITILENAIGDALNILIEKKHTSVLIEESRPHGILSEMLPRIRIGYFKVSKALYASDITVVNFMLKYDTC